MQRARSAAVSVLAAGRFNASLDRSGDWRYERTAVQWSRTRTSTLLNYNSTASYQTRLLPYHTATVTQYHTADHSVNGCFPRLTSPHRHERRCAKRPLAWSRPQSAHSPRRYLHPLAPPTSPHLSAPLHLACPPLSPVSSHADSHCITATLPSTSPRRQQPLHLSPLPAAGPIDQFEYGSASGVLHFPAPAAR